MYSSEDCAARPELVISSALSRYESDHLADLAQNAQLFTIEYTRHSSLSAIMAKHAYLQESCYTHHRAANQNVTFLQTSAYL